MPQSLHLLTFSRPLVTKVKALGALSSLAFLICCGGPERESPDRWDGGGGEGGLGGQSSVISVGTCSDGETDDRPCKVYHQQASGVTSCFNGIQYCDGGRWSDCIDPNNDPRVQ